MYPGRTSVFVELFEQSPIRAEQSTKAPSRVRVKVTTGAPALASSAEEPQRKEQQGENLKPEA
jgi:hypothetical protein